MNSLDTSLLVPSRQQWLRVQLQGAIQLIHTTTPD